MHGSCRQHSSFNLEYCYQEAFDMNTRKITEHFTRKLSDNSSSFNCRKLFWGFQEAFDNTGVLI